MKLLSDILLLLAFCYLENIFNNETSRSVVTVQDHQHDINGGEKTIAIKIKISPQNNPISNFSGCIMHYVGGGGLATVVVIVVYRAARCVQTDRW